MTRVCFAAAFLLLCLPIDVARSAVTACGGTVDCVPRLNTVYDVRNSDLSTDDYTSFYLVSYGSSTIASVVTPQDGAAGLFVRGDTCAVGKDNGGSILVDNQNTPSGAHHCFYRQNLNGDLRQWGITQGSSYDVIYNIQHGTPGSITNATPQIENAISGLAAVGIGQLHTHQVSIEIGLDAFNRPLTIPNGGSFTCDAPPVKNANNADFTQLPGSLVVTHSGGSTNFMDATSNDVEIHDCAAIIPEWYINPGIANEQFGGYNRETAAPANHPDLEAIRANMILAGDTAIMAGAGAYVHDIAIYGFDNCLNTTHAPSFHGRNVYMDCSIGAYFAHNGGGTSIKDFFNDNYLTKQPGSDVPVEEAWDIPSITPSSNLNAAGRPMCHITIQQANGGGPLFADLRQSATVGRGDPAYYPMWIAGPKAAGKSCTSLSTGQFGNDAAWAIESIVSGSSSTREFDLVGSDYASPTGPSNGIMTSATWLPNTGVLRISGPIANLAAGMQVTSSDTGWPTGCTPSPCQLTVVAVVARATGPDPNDGYNGEVIVSPAPSLANSGGDTAASITFSNTSAMYVDDAPCTLTSNGAANGNCAFLNAAERYVSGNSDAGRDIARLPASRGGHLGAGFLLEDVSGFRAVTTVSFAHYYNLASIDSPECDFTQIKGDEHGELGAGNSVGIYIAGASRGCNFVTRGPGQKGTSVVQDTYGTTDDTTGSLHQSTDASGLGQYSLGTLTVSSTSGWPARGVMHLCKHTATVGGILVCDTTTEPGTDEFVFYSCVTSGCTSGTLFDVEVRGQMGTAPVNWTGTATAFNTTVGNSVDVNEDKSTSMFVALTTPTVGNGNLFEIHHGAAMLQNIHTPGSGIGFVSSNTAGVTIAGTNLANASIVFEDGTARIQTTITPDSQFYNFVGPGATNLPVTALNPGGPTLVPSGLHGLGTDGTGTINVSDNTNWPRNGVLVADNEEMGFAVPPGDTGHLDITSRGECGTARATHAIGAAVRFIVTELPCGSAGLKGYASNGFTIGSPAGGDQGGGTLSAEKQIYENSGQTVPGIVCSSGTAQTATGTAEHVLASCKIPGGALGLNGCVAVDALWDWTSNANNKTIKAYANTSAAIGGTVYLSSISTTTTAQHTVVKICNRGAANSQIGGALSGTVSAGSTALPVSAINTGSDWYIVFTGQKAVSGDSLKLEQYQVVNQPF